MKFFKVIDIILLCNMFPGSLENNHSGTRDENHECDFTSVTGNKISFVYANVSYEDCQIEDYEENELGSMSCEELESMCLDQNTDITQIRETDANSGDTDNRVPVEMIAGLIVGVFLVFLFFIAVIKSMVSGRRRTARNPSFYETFGGEGYNGGRTRDGSRLDIEQTTLPAYLDTSAIVGQANRRAQDLDNPTCSTTARPTDEPYVVVDWR